MNIHFQQVERKSQLVSSLLAVFAVLTVLMLTLSFGRMLEQRLSIPSISMLAAQTENSALPVAIPVPLPPANQIQSTAIPEPVGNSASILLPQAIPVPVPSVP